MSESQDRRLVGSFSDWEKKYGARSAADFGNAETQRRILEQNPGIDPISLGGGSLERMYAEDQANQTAYDADPVVRSSRQTSEFEQQAPQIKQTLYEGAQQESRRGLADELAQTRQGASRRGLLYSGLRAGAEQGARASAGAGLASARSAINSSIQGQIDQMRKGSIQGGLQQYSNAMSAATEDYKNAMNRYKNKNAMMAQIGGGLGAVGGAYLTGGTPTGAMAGYQAGTMAGGSL